LLSPRTIDIEVDREMLLGLHFSATYESGTPWVRSVPFVKAREWWFNTSQVEEFLSDLTKSLGDSRTVAEVWEDDGSVVAFVWVTFTDIINYNLTFAEVLDIAVIPEYQQRGIGTTIMTYVEQLASERGANVLRSGTGIENTASRNLHDKLGFQTIHLQYEKILRGVDVWHKEVQ